MPAAPYSGTNTWVILAVLFLLFGGTCGDCQDKERDLKRLQDRVDVLERKATNAEHAR